MKILVTGGAGFIGSHTVVALVEAGFEPVIIDDLSNSEMRAIDGLSKILGKKPRFYRENCNDPGVLTRIIEAENITGVIHFAAFKAVGESMEMPLAYYQNNVSGLITLLEVMKNTGVKNLIFSSSCTVYGQPDALPVTENTPFKTAESVYGNTKQIGEEILRDSLRAGLPFNVIALRYFNPIGAHSSGLIGELPKGVPGNLIPYITQSAAGIRPALTIHGDDYDTPDGTCIRDYIHVMDLGEAHVAALKHIIFRENAGFYDAFNIGTGQGTSVLSMVKAFSEVTGAQLDFRIGPRRAGDVVEIYADVFKVNTILGWSATRSNELALEDAWRWQNSFSIS